ncbi:MAG: solute carrier family 23 protein [Thermovirgaceae bacterium]
MGNPAFVLKSWGCYGFGSRYSCPGGPRNSASWLLGILSSWFFCCHDRVNRRLPSLSYASGLDDPDEGTISRGIGAEGLNCALAGLFGATGTTSSYTENIGLIGAP